MSEYRVSYLSNGRDLISRRSPSGVLGAPVVLSDPSYDVGASVDAPASPPTSQGRGQMRSRDFGRRGLKFQSLPGFVDEAAAVTREWKSIRPDEPLVFLNRDSATEENLASLRRPKMLHLITHGFFLPDLEKINPQSLSDDLEDDGGETSEETELTDNRGLTNIKAKKTPRRPRSQREDPRLRSGLALAGANQWSSRVQAGQSDGLLTALEVENLDLWGTELVVLSACQTGLGKVQVGEGVLGLRRSFQKAGAATVVASLWKVPDAETEKLMSRFFELWLSGAPKSDALRQSQLELIHELRNGEDVAKRVAPPFFWAGFICHGDPN